MEIDEKKRYESALEYATKKHGGQFRIGGKPYITHPIEVSKLLEEKGCGVDYLITALFHDLLEDTDATEEEIEKIGGNAVLTAVKLLTKKKGYVMEEYVGKIKANDIAYAVKGADRLHNLRSALVASDDFKRRYILETIDWYMLFDSRIPRAVKELAESMEKPIAELELLYDPIEKWKINF